MTDIEVIFSTLRSPVGLVGTVALAELVQAMDSYPLPRLAEKAS